ncbi:MAG: recombinase family protein [Lachnospiraceae bacterium]|nr:recombinase family protein [Lachnospiraceae bacterium]
MKRVYCLYRVSTKKQVDKNDRNENDIPMQKTACRDFARSQRDWTILKEFSEAGVSGYKVSAQDRDAIQELKEAAVNDEFDILLVFMFDRIGRIDDETPFVVEWFAKHGIEVWSTQEGQQRFDNHVDKLMNYLRFWQASGESEKTSIRIRNKMQQMALDGLYTGGPVRFGYRLVDSGLVNRKGVMIRKYEIDPVESEVLYMIDSMTLQKGYGSYRMADFLNKKGIRTNTGGKFTSIKINRILHDPFYCGRMEDGTTSEKLAALKLRSEETYGQILSLLEQRQSKNEEKRHIALQTKGQAMLSGNIFCAHCGGRLTTIRYRDRYLRADGTEYSVDQIKYCCYHKSRKLCKCDGQTTYQADRVDDAICRVIRKLFSCMDGAPEEERLRELFKRQMAGNRASQKKLELELAKNREQLSRLQMEIGKTLTGESLYSPEDLTQAIQTIRSRVNESETRLAELKEEEMLKKQGLDMVAPTYNQFKSWAEEFDTATLEQKKMIAGHLFSRIEVGRDYRITAELNMTYQQFCSEWSDGSFLVMGMSV